MNSCSRGILFIVAAYLAGAVVVPTAYSAPYDTMDELKRARHEAAHRRRRVIMDDDFTTNPRRGLRAQVQLPLRIDASISPEALQISVNGQVLDRGIRTNGWIDYAVDVSAIRQGYNAISVTPNTVGTLEDLMVWVRY